MGGSSLDWACPMNAPSRYPPETLACHDSGAAGGSYDRASHPQKPTTRRAASLGVRTFDRIRLLMTQAIPLSTCSVSNQHSSKSRLCLPMLDQIIGPLQ